MMNERNGFYSPNEMNYGDIVPAYQEAFKGWPWYEVSKCVDAQARQRCEGGLSRVALRAICGTCDTSTFRPAYEADELTNRFGMLGETRPTRWYAEEVGQRGIALAAVAWTADAQRISAEKYQNNTAMESWLERTMGDGEFVWLDEVFADKTVRERGNLRNFGKMCNGFMDIFENDTLAFRTINPAMTRAAERDCNGAVPIVDTPDRRDFIVIKRGEK